MKKLIILGVVGVAVVGFFLYAANVYKTTRNEGNAKELALTGKFKSMMGEYGQDRMAVTDSLGIARENADAMDKILQNAVSGRYNKEGGKGEVDSNLLFKAISEAYPDLSGVSDLYKKVLDYVIEARKKFGQKQSEIATAVQEYQTWRTTGSLLHPIFASWMGYPSNLIEIRVGDKVYRGQEALDKMSTAIVGSDTNRIIDTGVDEQLVPSTPKK